MERTGHQGHTAEEPGFQQRSPRLLISTQHRPGPFPAVGPIYEPQLTQHLWLPGQNPPPQGAPSLPPGPTSDSQTQSLSGQRKQEREKASHRERSAAWPGRTHGWQGGGAQSCSAAPGRPGRGALGLGRGSSRTTGPLDIPEGLGSPVPGEQGCPWPH